MEKEDEEELDMDGWLTVLMRGRGKEGERRGEDEGIFIHEPGQSSASKSVNVQRAEANNNRINVRAPLSLTRECWRMHQNSMQRLVLEGRSIQWMALRNLKGQTECGGRGDIIRCQFMLPKESDRLRNIRE